MNEVNDHALAELGPATDHCSIWNKRISSKEWKTFTKELGSLRELVESVC